MAICVVSAATSSSYQYTTSSGSVDNNGWLVVDPAGSSPSDCSGYILVTSSEYQTSVFDPVQGGAIFSFFFASVVGLWYLSKNLSLILSAVRRM